MSIFDDNLGIKMITVYFFNIFCVGYTSNIYCAGSSCEGICNGVLVQSSMLLYTATSKI